MRDDVRLLGFCIECLGVGQVRSAGIYLLVVGRKGCDNTLKK